MIAVLIVMMAVVLRRLALKATGSGAPAPNNIRQVTSAQTSVRPVTSIQTDVREVTALRPAPSSGPFSQLIGPGARYPVKINTTIAHANSSHRHSEVVYDDDGRPSTFEKQPTLLRALGPMTP